MKWYEYAEVDDDAIISSRVRFARNLKGYPFTTRISMAGALAIIEKMKGIKDDGNALARDMDFVLLRDLSQSQLNDLAERHVISPAMAKPNNVASRALLYGVNEDVSIMINEEDHLRIHAIAPAKNLDAAFEKANAIDDALAEIVEYAFDREFGFLTSCPTNTGTGMRASFMLHLPLLEQTGELKSIVEPILKGGFALRGTHGEGSEVMGSVYQISNQVTMGVSEKESIEALVQITEHIVRSELEMRKNAMKGWPKETEDMVYRSYATLKYARLIGLKEAMKCLSDVRMGNILGIIKCRLLGDITIYKTMNDILTHNLQSIMGPAMDMQRLAAMRAEYLRKIVI